MDNKKTIEKFNKDIDRVILGKSPAKIGRSHADIQVMEIARRLDQEDFSGSSQKRQYIRMQLATLATGTLDTQEKTAFGSPHVTRAVSLVGLIILTAMVIGLFRHNLVPQAGISSQVLTTTFAPHNPSPVSLQAPELSPISNQVPTPQLLPTPGTPRAATRSVSSGLSPALDSTYLAHPSKLPQ